jgi:hypothetical protein
VWRRRVLEAPRVERIAELAESGVTLKILGTVRAADQWAAAGDFRRRLLEAFRTNGIELSGAPLEIPARDAVGDPGAGRAPDEDAPDEDAPTKASD